MKIITAAAAAFSLSISNTFATSQDDSFQKVAHDYVEQYLQANPEQATELGDHRFDGQLTDYSSDAQAKDLATQKEFRDKLNAIDGSQLTGANNVDFRILKENIDYKKWLQSDLLPRSDGDFRLGALKYRKKLRFALASDLPMEEIMKRAKADLGQTQTAIYETALPLYKRYFPNADQQTLADTRKLTAAVLDKLAEQHPNDATVVDYAKKVVTEATDFVKRHDVVGIRNVPLDVIAMPEFKRGVAIAYCAAPGPLEKNGKTFFAVAPTPKDWSKE